MVMPNNLLMRPQEWESLSTDAKKAFNFLLNENQRLKAEQVRRRIVDAANRAQEIRNVPLFKPSPSVEATGAQPQAVTMTELASLQARHGFCPKCHAQKLQHISSGGGLVFQQCASCDIVSVLVA